jgi:hypothetical protein
MSCRVRPLLLAVACTAMLHIAPVDARPAVAGTQAAAAAPAARNAALHALFDAHEAWQARDNGMVEVDGACLR